MTYEEMLAKRVQAEINVLNENVKSGKVTHETVYEELYDGVVSAMMLVFGEMMFNHLKSFELTFDEENGDGTNLQVYYEGPRLLHKLLQTEIAPPLFTKDLIDAAVHAPAQGEGEDQDGLDVLGRPSGLPSAEPEVGADHCEPAEAVRAEPGGREEEQPDLQGPDGPDQKGPSEG